MAYFTERVTKKVTLPSNPDYWVEVKTDLKYGELKKLVNIDEEDKAGASDQMLLLAISSWNLDGEDGEVAEINQDTINLLSNDDITALMQEIASIGGDSESKKNS